MIERYDVDELDGTYPHSEGDYLIANDVIEYLQRKLEYYELRQLVYRADTLRKILKDFPK